MPRALLYVIALLCCLAATPAHAGLAGQWVFSYRTPDGLAVTAPCAVTDQGDEFTGTAKYPLHGRIITDVLEGKVSQSGNAVFTIARHGMVLKHKGKLSDDGRTITGWYNESAGAGTFTLERAAKRPGYPRLTGEWTYVFSEPGASPHSATCVMESFAGGTFAGNIRYKGVSAMAAFKGSMDPRGNLKFTMEEAGRKVEHTGTISADRKAITGRWVSDWSSGPFTITRP